MLTPAGQCARSASTTPYALLRRGGEPPARILTSKPATSNQFLSATYVDVARTAGFGVRGLCPGGGAQSRGPQHRRSALPLQTNFFPPGLVSAYTRRDLCAFHFQEGQWRLLPGGGAGHRSFPRRRESNSASLLKCPTHGLDSRLRGNDWLCGRRLVRDDQQHRARGCTR
jgi:hypothetical protein